MTTLGVLGVNLAVFLERDGLHRVASVLTVRGILDAESIWSPFERLRYANTRNELVTIENGNSIGLDSRTPIRGSRSPSRTGDAYFQIRLKGGETFIGWPRTYGQRGSESEIYLSPACELRGDPVRLSPIPGPGVVIKEREVAFTVLVDRRDRQSGQKHECWMVTE